jgi:RNA polymerase sigma-32 factor
MATTVSLAERDMVDRYVAEVNNHPLLTREEERQLTEEYARTQDQTIADKLVVSNLRFVVKIAHEYKGYNLGLLDLIQEGNVGLMLAVKKFDPEKGYRLISYAVWWIRAYMQAFIMRSWSLVKIGTTAAQRKLFFKLRSERQEADRLAEPGEKAEASTIAHTLGVAEKEVTSMEMRLAARDYSLDVKVGNGEDARRTYLDQLPAFGSTPEESVAEAEERHQFRQRLRQAALDLDERERYILDERLASDEPKTLRQIGERFRISRERARQIQENIVGKMRAALVEGELVAA